MVKYIAISFKLKTRGRFEIADSAEGAWIGFLDENNCAPEAILTKKEFDVAVDRVKKITKRRKYRTL